MSYRYHDEIPESTLVDDDYYGPGPSHRRLPRIPETRGSEFSDALRSAAKTASEMRRKQYARHQGGRSLPPRASIRGGRSGGNRWNQLTPLPPATPQGTRNAKATSPTIDLTEDEESASILPEAAQTLPSQLVITLEQSLRQKQTRDLTIEDFTTEGRSDGTSLLIARLIDMIKDVHGEMSPFQLARLAAHAIVHHPRRLLEYLTDTNATTQLI